MLRLNPDGALPHATSERHGVRAGDLRGDSPEIHPHRPGRASQHVVAQLLAVVGLPRAGPVPRRSPQDPPSSLSWVTARLPRLISIGEGGRCSLNHEKWP